MMFAIAFAAAIAIDPAFCRSSGPGQARWSADGSGSLWASTDGPTTGYVVLRCRVRLAHPAGAVTIAWDHALVQFTSLGRKTSGDGVQMRVGERGVVSLTMVAGEDWIEAPPRRVKVELSAPARTVEFELRLIDSSRELSVRADLRNLRVTAVK